MYIQFKEDCYYPFKIITIFTTYYRNEGHPGPAPGSDAVNFSEINRLRAGASQRPVHPDGHEGRGHRRQAGGQADAAGGTLHHEHEVHVVGRMPPGLHVFVQLSIVLVYCILPRSWRTFTCFFECHMPVNEVVVCCCCELGLPVRTCASWRLGEGGRSNKKLESCSTVVCVCA